MRFLLQHLGRLCQCQQFPWGHCDCLATSGLVLSQSMGEHSTADDMLDRCLYAFEMAWHHSFNIATANSMLDPEREENKGFFEALFRHLQVSIPSQSSLLTTTLCCIRLMTRTCLNPEPVVCMTSLHVAPAQADCLMISQGLSRRGLHRPALEVAKLLLALDWHDPTGECARHTGILQVLPASSAVWHPGSVAFQSSCTCTTSICHT